MQPSNQVKGEQVQEGTQLPVTVQLPDFLLQEKAVQVKQFNGGRTV
jgi:hypothetical protein